MAHQIEDGVAMRFEAPPRLSPEACASIHSFRQARRLRTSLQQNLAARCWVAAFPL
jgi:hypothetical protein